MNVDLVTIKASDGVQLDGVLRTPESGTALTLPVDIVIMHHGVGGNFYRDSFQDLGAEVLGARLRRIARQQSWTRSRL